jgi:hypothetical protein
MLASPTFAGPDGRRSTTASSPWWCEWRLARTLASRHCARLVPLGPLDDFGVRTAVAAALGTADPPSELVTAVGERAGGSPFLIEELLASLVGVGALVRSGVGWKVRGALPAVVPESFAMAVADRLAALSTPARGVVELATVLGERFDWRLVAATASGDVVGALREADQACRVQNAAVVPDQRFQAAASYSLRSPPRIGRRLILPSTGAGTGDVGRGGRSRSVRCGRRAL